jgi:hypothetical protein
MSIIPRLRQLTVSPPTDFPHVCAVAMIAGLDSLWPNPNSKSQDDLPFGLVALQSKTVCEITPNLS